MALQSTADKRTTLDIQREIDARADDIRRRLAALKHELTTFSDVTAAGQPVLDRLRADPERAVALGAGAGFALGSVSGLLAWRRRRKEVRSEGHAARTLIASLLGEASAAVAKGQKPEVALREWAKGKGPLVYYAPAPTPARGAVREQLDLAFKTAMGFALKAGMDQLTKKLTGKPEVFQAAKDATANPPPERPFG